MSSPCFYLYSAIGGKNVKLTTIANFFSHSQTIPAVNSEKI